MPTPATLPPGLEGAWRDWYEEAVEHALLGMGWQGCNISALAVQHVPVPFPDSSWARLWHTRRVRAAVLALVERGVVAPMQRSTSIYRLAHPNPSPPSPPQP